MRHPKVTIAGIGVAVAADGSQVAYNGHLLYTFASDRPGRVTGQNFQNFFVPPPIATSPTATGTVPAGI